MIATVTGRKASPEAARVLLGLADVQRCQHCDLYSGVSTVISTPIGALTKKTQRRVEPFGEHPSRHQTDRATARRDCGRDPDGAVPLGSFGERGGDQGRRRRRGDGAADALEGPGREQLPGFPCPSAQQGDQNVDDEDPAAAEDVTCPAAEQEQRATPRSPLPEPPCFPCFTSATRAPPDASRP
jgi:hypothetical protein